MTLAALTLAHAARMMRDAVKDRSYVGETGLGQAVDGFLTYFRTERGKTPETVRSYEYAAFGRKPNSSALQDLSPRPPERVAAGAACNTDRRGLRPEAVSPTTRAEAC